MVQAEWERFKGRVKMVFVAFGMVQAQCGKV